MWRDVTVNKAQTQALRAIRKKVISVTFGTMVDSFDSPDLRLKKAQAPEFVEGFSVTGFGLADVGPLIGALVALLAGALAGLLAGAAPLAGPPAGALAGLLTAPLAGLGLGAWPTVLSSFLLTSQAKS